MEIDKFGEHKTGQLVRIELPTKDWSFIPDFLPTEWKIPYGLWPLIAQVKMRLGTLDGKCSQLPNPELLLHPLQSREAMTSSRLEGTYVEPEELLLFELDREEGKPPSKGEAEDWREVSNYTLALQHGFDEMSRRGLSLSLIKDMHSILMNRTRGRDASPGEFRKRRVKIGHAGRFVPPPPLHVNGLMDNLEDQINLEDVAEVLVHCYQIHYQFEAIHPFEDGNGRVGRLLLALMIYKCLGHQKPWLYMSAFFEKFKDEYTDNLFKVSSDGRWTEWIEFCLRGTIRQADDAILRCDLFGDLKEELEQRLDSIDQKSARMVKIVDKLFESPVLTVPHVARKYNVHYQTAKRDVERLMEAGILKVLPRIRPKSYYAPRIFDIAFGQPEDIEDMTLRREANGE